MQGEPSCQHFVLDKTGETDDSLSIAAVEREVGLSKDVLRVWERRYGFPTPLRDPHGERCYPADQVRRLGLIKRLMDRGHRPGALLRMPDRDLLALAAPATPARHSASDASAKQLDEMVALVRQGDEQALPEALQRQLAHAGLQRFVLDTVAPLTVRIGQDWAAGQLQIHEEHLFTEVVNRVLRQAIAHLPRGTGPRVLLTTLPGEHHALGLLMVESILALHGARCVSLGTQMPMLQIVRAAGAHAAHAVALSFSAAFGSVPALRMTQQLRQALPSEVRLWVGGAGAARLGRIAGVQRIADLDAAHSLLASHSTGDALGAPAP